MTALLILAMVLLVGFAAYALSERRDGHRGCWYWGHEWTPDALCQRCGRTVIEVHDH